MALIWPDWLSTGRGGAGYDLAADAVGAVGESSVSVGAYFVPVASGCSAGYVVFSAIIIAGFLFVWLIGCESLGV